MGFFWKTIYPVPTNKNDHFAQSESCCVKLDICYVSSPVYPVAKSIKTFLGSRNVTRRSPKLVVIKFVIESGRMTITVMAAWGKKNKKTL